jgi:hypothetical protein
MQPATTRIRNDKEFPDIKHTVSLRSAARKNLAADPGYAAAIDIRHHEGEGQ